MEAKEQKNSFVLDIICATAVLACLVWSLYFRAPLKEDYDKVGGEVPLYAKLALESHWVLWILSAILVALILRKICAVLRRYPIFLSVSILLAAAVYAVVFFYAIIYASFFVGSGTWEDDPRNWYRAFREETPAEVEVIHSHYWKSNHWTDEYIYFFEVKAGAEWKATFLQTHDVVLINPSEARSSRTDCGNSDIPVWFAPDPVDKYDVYDVEGRYGRIWVDKANGHIHFYGMLF